MVKVLKHGEEYFKKMLKQEPHIYKCGYLRGCSEIVGGCGCMFEATLSDFVYSAVGHGEMDYVGTCPECGRKIYDSINRVN